MAPERSRNPWLNPHYYQRPDVQKKTELIKRAHDILGVVESGTYTDADGTSHNISHLIEASVAQVALYDEHSNLLANWATGPRLAEQLHETSIEFVPSEAAAAARELAPAEHIGVLHSTHATKTGSFLRGGDDAASALTRVSTLDATLRTTPIRAFLASHRGDAKRSHRLVYTPQVAIVRGADGAAASPTLVNVVSASPVNAGAVLARAGGDIARAQIERVMRERLARVLRLFEERGDTHLVLGAFGVEMQHQPDAIARIWASLVGYPGTPFYGRFSKIVFAVPGRLFKPFTQAFDMRVYEDELDRAMSE